MALLHTSDYVSGVKQQPISDSGAVVAAKASYTVPASARSAGDTVALLNLPAGHVPVDFYLTATDLDTGTSFTLSAGILNTAQTAISTSSADGGAAWISASTVGQAGGLVRPTTAAIADVEPSSSNRVVGIAFAAIGSSTAGTIKVTMTYRRSRHGE